MTDLEFFKEFLSRFDLGIPNIEEVNNYCTIYAIDLFDKNADNAGQMYFTFENKTGKQIEAPYFHDWREEQDIEDIINGFDTDQALDTMEILIQKLKNEY